MSKVVSVRCSGRSGGCLAAGVQCEVQYEVVDYRNQAGEQAAGAGLGDGFMQFGRPEQTKPHVKDRANAQLPRRRAAHRRGVRVWGARDT
jgi:hypothetical protein